MAVLLKIVSYFKLLPVARYIRAKIRSVGCTTDEEIFSHMYEKNLFKGGGSGYGSKPCHARPYLKFLQKHLTKTNIKTIADLGCGDWQLMSQIKIPTATYYTGFDIAKSVIDANTKNYKKKNITFCHIHSLEDFQSQKADLLLIKDVMQHWPNKKIQFFIENILPNFKYALITNDYCTKDVNHNVPSGGYRPIDLEAAPFNVKGLKVLLDYSIPEHGETKRVYLYKNPAKKKK